MRAAGAKIAKRPPTRAGGRFNVIQIVAGLYPDMHPFDPRGANEAGFLWEKDYTRIRPEYYDAADARLRELVDHGFTPCIVGAWGYFLPMMGEEKMKAHWRYLIAYGANGIWQLNRRGQPHGPSPHGKGNGYGVIAWDEAMLLPGSEQMGIGKQFFESLPWTRLTPMPQNVAWSDAPADSKESPLFAPQMCGQGESLRAIYVLAPRPILVSKLKPQSTYRVTYFDPVTGKRTPIAPITSGADGQWRCDAPDYGHDWVLLVELAD